jgi:hypothetical protein
MPKDAISSPMQNAFGHTASEHGTKQAVTDHNVCPVFSKPRDRGPDGIPEVFFTTVEGRGAHGKPGKDAAKISTTMEG